MPWTLRRRMPPRAAAGRDSTPPAASVDWPPGPVRRHYRGVVYAVDSPAHRGHDPGSEVAAGTVARYPESPARAESIRAALGADQRITLCEPAEHGLEPVLAV